MIDMFSEDGNFRKKIENDSSKLAIDLARQEMIKSYQHCLETLGKDRIQAEITSLKNALQYSNKILGSTLSININFVDAMIFAMSSVPPRMGFEIMKDQKFIDFSQVLYGIRAYLAAERDEKLKGLDIK